MAKDGLFFKGAAGLHPTRKIPTRSMQFQAIWAIFLILSGSLGTRGAQLYSDLLTFTSFASLLFNALTIAGLFVLRKKRPDLPRPYRVVGYPFLPLAFLATAIFFLVFIAVGDPRNSGFGALIIVSGIPFFLLLRRKAGRAVTQSISSSVGRKTS
jgi:APA family basic amino acid/polyamine antiporter